MDKYIADRKSSGDESFYDPSNRTEKLSFKEHWALMDKKEKKEYFNAYLRLPVIIICVILIMASVGFWILNKNMIVDILYIHVYGSDDFDSERLEVLSEDLYDKLGLKNKRRIYFDSLPYYDPEEYGENKNRGLMEQLDSDSDKWDMIICSSVIGEVSYEKGEIIPLSEVLDEETLALIPEENLIYYKDTEKTAENAYGISLKDSKIAECYNGSLIKPEKLVLFICDRKNVRKQSDKINSMIQIIFN